MNTADLVERVAVERGVAKEHVRKILDSAFAAIMAAVENGEDVSLSGFGRFKLSSRDPRRGPQSRDRRNDRNSRFQKARFHRGQIRPRHPKQQI